MWALVISLILGNAAYGYLAGDLGWTVASTTGNVAMLAVLWMGGYLKRG